MGLRYREHRELRRVQQALGQSDPHLCAMLAIFSRLATGECLPARERIPRSVPYVPLASTGSAVALLACRILAACARTVRRTVRCGLAGVRFLSAGARLAATCSLPGHDRPVPRTGLAAGDVKN